MRNGFMHSRLAAGMKAPVKGPQRRTLILVLGALFAIGPFSIEMYLPGFPAIAADLQTDIAHVGLSLTSYFVGISVGQLGWGPVMDRYGRKKPLTAGLFVYIGAALGCAFSPSIHSLITMRLFLALGACVGVAGARAMVRDLFSGSAAAKVLSTMVMIFGVSPIVAPTVGGIVAGTLGWRYIFLILAGIALLILLAVNLLLGESKGADASISLHPRSVVRDYCALFRERAFVTYLCASSAGVAGFFSYISGSPFVYMGLFRFTAVQFGWMYAANAAGLIIGSQMNRRWLRTRSGEQILLIIVGLQFSVIMALLAGSYLEVIGRTGTIGLVLGYVFCHGFVNPNAMALALEPFTKHAGSAAAMIGSIQMFAGATASGLVSHLHNGTAMPMIGVMSCCSSMSLLVLGGGALLRRQPAGH